MSCFWEGEFYFSNYSSFSILRIAATTIVPCYYLTIIFQFQHVENAEEGSIFSLDIGPTAWKEESSPKEPVDSSVESVDSSSIESESESESEESSEIRVSGSWKALFTSPAILAVAYLAQGLMFFHH